MKKVLFLTWTEQAALTRIGKGFKKYSNHKVSIDHGHHVGQKEEHFEYDKVVTHDMNSFEEEFKDRIFAWVSGIPHRPLNNLKRFENILCHTNFIAEDKGLKGKENVHVCPAGVDTEKFKPLDLKKKYKLGCVETHLPLRNLDVLEDAGVFTHDWRQGEWISDEELCKLYNEMRAYINISDYEAGHLPLLEAGACGVPIISTPVGYAPDIESCHTIKNPTKRKIQSLDIRNLENPRDEILKDWSWKTLVGRWEEVLDL